MSINKLGLNKNLIDVQSAAKVSEQLFTALEKKSVDYSKVNLSKFNRPTVGIDFYNSKTDINLQREISIANSGAFQTVNLTSVQALNSLAAQALYSNAVAEKVGGKMTIDNPYGEFEFITKTEDADNIASVFEAYKDKKDSNPFSFDGFASKSNKEEM